MTFANAQYNKIRTELFNLLIKIYWHTEFTEFTEYRTHIVCARLAHAKTQRKDERLKMNVERWEMRVQRRCLVLRFWGERWKMNDEGEVSFWGSEVQRFWGERWKMRGEVSFWGSEVQRFWGERWKMRGINFAPLCAFAWHTNIISVNFPTAWSESKAIRYSVNSVNSVCNLNTAALRLCVKHKN